MEDVLDLYEEPLDPKRPMVCFDEQPYQLLSDVLEPLPPQPGNPKIQDYNYQRQGVCNFFMMFQPANGWRHVDITEHRTKTDYAQQLKELADVHFPEAEVIRLVQDNLNTHALSSLYDAFSPQEARRLAKRFEFHYTPKHASWLNMAEIEFSVLNGQCTDRRFADREMLKKEIAAWEKERNLKKASVKWQFTTTKAREKLKQAYPL